MLGVIELWALRALAGVIIGGAVGLAYAGAIGSITLSAPSPADPVKEYAMNRLCQISYLECRRLDTIAAKVQSHDGR